jgi:N-acetylglucosamine-6-phosphate deacetylase
MKNNMQAFYNGTIFTGTEQVHHKAVLTENGIITDIVPESSIPAMAEKIDLRGNFLAPALIDLQIYGGNGKLFSELLSVEALQATYAYCLSGGCTQFMITMATNSIETFLKGVDLVSTYWRQGGKGLLGLHLEGPYINPVKRGAHIEAFVKKPTIAEVTSLVTHGKGVIKMMTLAPEQCDAAIIKLLLDNGVLLSAGHSNATYQQSMHGFDLGIPAATHLFNAMSPLQHRTPGLVGAIYDHPSAMSSIVADGIHVDFVAVRVSKKIMHERLFLITDAVAETNTGAYQHHFKENRFCLPDGTLSGSALTMMKAVKNCVQKAGIDAEEALRMASLYPARLIGRSNELGKIEKGYKAEFVVFDKAFDVIQTIH